MKKVVKFGGSSLASAEQFKKVGDIIRKDPSRRYVVPSAPGKRFSDDTKVTDMLYSCYAAAVKEKKFTELLDKIKERYQEIIDGLGLDFSLDEDFDIIRVNFSKKIGRDYAASRGEYLNGKVMAAYLGFEFVDAAEVIRFSMRPNSMTFLSSASMMTEHLMTFLQTNCFQPDWQIWKTRLSPDFTVQKKTERLLLSPEEDLTSADHL